MVVGSIGDRHRNGRSAIAGQVGRPLVFVGKLFPGTEDGRSGRAHAGADPPKAFGALVAQQ